MKKIRIESKPNTGLKRIRIFESAEALYVWLVNKQTREPEGSFLIEISDGEFIEAEWCGFEYAHGTRLDFIRLAKGMPTKNASGTLVSVHYGWVTENEMTFRESEDDQARTVKLHDPSEWRLDLAVLFMDDEASEKEVRF